MGQLPFIIISLEKTKTCVVLYLKKSFKYRPLAQNYCVKFESRAYITDDVGRKFPYPPIT